jgi:hypothetical protein
MPMTMCSKCMFCFDPFPGTIESLDKPKLGVCRRHAPDTPVLLANGGTMTLWPNVKIFHDGCGEGEIGLALATQ